jgi:hypothetical protein
VNYKFVIVVIFSFFLSNCDQHSYNKIKNNNIDIVKKYKNAGFALIYNENLENLKKLDQRSLNIYHKTLKKKSLVKVKNPINGKILIAEVKSNKIKFSQFYNSVITSRIVEALDLNENEPYIEIVLISENSTFIAKKAKTYKEEREVAEKAPIDGIQIKDLNIKKTTKKKNKTKNFLYSIKIADFYYKDTAKIMVDRIKKEVSINNSRIIKLSKTKYRVLIGPFNDIKSLKESFEKINSLNFENLEILKNV